MSIKKENLRTSVFPTIWCPGCGHGIITHAILRACEEMGWNKDEMVGIAGIGCSSRAPSYLDCVGAQTTHGRAIAFATGIKTVQPDKHVFLTLGDGDCCAIGGNHFIHACRRNIDMTIVVMNNYIYGMTGGQVSPTTPELSYSTTTPYGNIDNPFDVCNLAIASGATFVARATAANPNQICSLIKKGFQNRGVSVIEVLAPCPTGFGGKNGFRHVTEMYDYLKEVSVSIEKATKMTEEELENKIITGVLKNKQLEEYCDKYNRIVVSGAKYTPPLTIPTGDYIVEEPLNSERYECRFAGTGGQGLLSTGRIFADAMIRQGQQVVYAQSYGSEKRGGASRSEVIVGNEEVGFPGVLAPDFLVAMSQRAYDEFAPVMKEGSVVVCDSTYVEPMKLENIRQIVYPVTRIAVDEIGNIHTANVLALGLLTGTEKFISKEAMLDAISARVPKKALDKNLKAFEMGYQKGLESRNAKQIKE